MSLKIGRKWAFSGRAWLCLALSVAAPLACKSSDSPPAPPTVNEAGAANQETGGSGDPAAGAGGASNPGTGEGGNAAMTEAGAPTGVGGDPGMLGMGGVNSEPGSWDTSTWDEAVWQ